MKTRPRIFCGLLGKRLTRKPPCPLRHTWAGPASRSSVQLADTAARQGEAGGGGAVGPGVCATQGGPRAGSCAGIPTTLGGPGRRVEKRGPSGASWSERRRTRSLGRPALRPRGPALRGAGPCGGAAARAARGPSRPPAPTPAPRRAGGCPRRPRGRRPGRGPRRHLPLHPVGRPRRGPSAGPADPGGVLAAPLQPRLP
ncbi:hypothetical protein VULLAG_LOCUS21995 [Vulpes lagopus]